MNSIVDIHNYTTHTQSQKQQVKMLGAADQNRLLKQGIWAYFLLLIFEGALRKWFLPGLSTPLLVIRDPLVLWLIIKVWQRGMFPSSIYIFCTLLIGIIGIYASIFLGHGSLPVALYGARILLLHFPMMFVIGQVFNQEDVILIGKATLLLAIPMAILIFFQFYSPQSSWVNRGVGGDMEGAGFSGSLGYSRPPGTFSFTNGLTLFFSFVAPFVVYFWFNVKKINKWILLGATLGLLAAIPLSISRSLFFSVVVTLGFALLILFRRPQFLFQSIVTAVGFIVALMILGEISFFKVATEAFTARFENANDVEGGVEGVLLDRYLGGLIKAITGGTRVDLPFFGYGLGIGTNVGSMLITGGLTYLVAEGEWGRLLGELGFLLGMAMIFVRVSFCFNLAFDSFKKLSMGDILPWLLMSFGVLIIPQGQWAQPTSLGFSTLIGGLILASLRPSIKIVN